MRRNGIGAVHIALGILVASLAWISCQKSRDLPLEAGFGGASTVGSLHEVILPATEVKQIRPDINFGLGPYLLVGQRGGLVAKSYFLFDALPESAVVTFAELRFASPYIFGEGQIRIRLFPVSSEWEEEDVVWENQPDVDYSRTIGDTVWSSHDSLGVLVRLDTAAVNGWIRDRASNKGFVLEAEPEPEVLFELYSIDSGNLDLAPHLWLRYVEGDKLDSARTFPSADVFAAHRDHLPTEAAYSVAGQDVERVLLKFDLDQLPKGATINRAQFEWSLEPAHTQFEGSTITLSLHHVTEWPWEGEYVAFDSSRYRVNLTLQRTDALLTLTSLDQIQNFSHLLQLILAGSLQDNGFLLRVAREDVSVGRIALVPAGTDSTTGPRLIVTYTVPPGAGE